MGFDNRILNINGRGVDRLAQALSLAAGQVLSRADAFAGAIEHPTAGLILKWNAGSGEIKFDAPLDAAHAADFAMQWLSSPAAKAMKCSGWDADLDHDGSNVPGWRVYCEDWGHVAGSDYAICAVRPAFLWLGK